MSGFVSYRIEAEGAIQDLRAAAGKSRSQAQKGLRRGIKDIAVPRARARAPHQTGRYASSMKGAVAGLTGFIVSSDVRAGLLEFGGTRRDVIHAKPDHALSIPRLGFFAAVKGPRTYKATHSMRRAAVASESEIANITRDAVVEAFAVYFPVSR